MNSYWIYLNSFKEGLVRLRIITEVGKCLGKSIESKGAKYRGETVLKKCWPN